MSHFHLNENILSTNILQDEAIVMSKNVSNLIQQR